MNILVAVCRRDPGCKEGDGEQSVADCVHVGDRRDPGLGWCHRLGCPESELRDGI